MKTIRYTFLCFCSLLWAVGCHPTLRRTTFEWGLFPDSYRYGDLYHLANLPQFKQKTQNCAKKYTDSTTKTNTALYILGDSFTEKERLSSEDFISNSYTRIHWSDSIVVSLDPTKRNILLLETVERHFREHFAMPVRQIKIDKHPKVESRKLKAESHSQKTWTEILQKSEESLIAVLFSSDFFLFFKECKATLNLRFFDRHSDQVALSPDGKHLFYCWDTDSTRITSCFKYLPDTELKNLIDASNQARLFYLNQGFDEVYLSIIPNKTSILGPEMGDYNHLVERVQQHPNLKVPFINVWPAFLAHRQQVYSHSDTHWNCTGQAIWLQAVNKHLEN